MDTSHFLDRLDLLFNNAGAGFSGFFDRQTKEDWEKAFALNFYGALRNPLRAAYYAQKGLRPHRQHYFGDRVHANGLSDDVFRYESGAPGRWPQRRLQVPRSRIPVLRLTRIAPNDMNVLKVQELVDKAWRLVNKEITIGKYYAIRQSSSLVGTHTIKRGEGIDDR